jgi:copper chaperone CopZ
MPGNISYFSIFKLISMKALTIFSFISLFVSMSSSSFAQDLKTETIPVSGNCGTCKTNIEKAAKKAGATDADWNVDTKMLTVKYNTAATNADKIQQGIAEVGYDTRDVKAADAAYDKLHACCKYERSGAKKDDKPAGLAKKEASCCDKGECKKDEKTGTH